MKRPQITLALQVLTFYAILASPLGGTTKTALFLLLWGITFWPLKTQELYLVLVVNIVFTANNILAVQNGTFHFLNPDLWGLPAYEFFLWGYYSLHALRFHDLKIPRPNWLKLLLATTLFAASFSIFPTQTGILLGTSAAFFLLLLLFHEKDDLRGALHFIVLGTVLEYLGVHFGQWGYPGDYIGGVAYWYINLFGGVGILCRRLMLPLLKALEKSKTVS